MAEARAGDAPAVAPVPAVALRPPPAVALRPPPPVRTATPSGRRVTSTVPSWSVRYTRAPTSRSRASTEGVGWP